jgi:hypothetical protein
MFRRSMERRITSKTLYAPLRHFDGKSLDATDPDYGLLTTNSH